MESSRNLKMKFDDLFDVLVKDLTENQPADTSPALKWFQQVLLYNVPHGKKNRGLTVVQSYEFLIGEKKEMSDEDFKITAVVGWCIELLQAFFLVSDDVMDHSITRRGRPCWYTVPGVGLIAMNDALYIESSVYKLLKKYIRNKPYYIDIVDLFHETIHQTIVGQCLDLLTSKEVNLDGFTLDRYNAIVKYKTAYYSFHLPVACAIYMVGINDERSHQLAKDILLKMGEYFQVQDDYLDCFGDPELTGKLGTDIEDNKCSWLIVQAWSKADNRQKEILKVNYGKPEECNLKMVKMVYEELNLRTVYEDYEAKSFQEISKLIEGIDSCLPKTMFNEFAKKIYKRNK
ncbi:hypothetical protein HELRODRAFT_115552 [Helobdella robusta]|uniref:Farnesyl pyrophosphate synthase n=1 Tax=Helobdella robusta TaxID=6412 RepID=T1EG91_HELRO|nr:hypothetical protein HELRODRAFT_115552 [Helobdella robusta]ESN93504.1 hypothetical protein HELRODRAFT_115552 [Helobdella robusta]